MYSSMYLVNDVLNKSEPPSQSKQIAQLDGNMSLSSTSSLSTSLDTSSLSTLNETHCSAVNSIPVILGNRLPQNNLNENPRKSRCLKLSGGAIRPSSQHPFPLSLSTTCALFSPSSTPSRKTSRTELQDCRS